jgi:hypothetical protein
MLLADCVVRILNMVGDLCRKIIWTRETSKSRSKISESGEALEVGVK